ncbi:uncharacterized protein LOC144471995 [Augochlora pura]
MGNIIKMFRTSKKPYDNNLITDNDHEIIKTIWLAVGKDSAYYGFAMCTILYKNHPQYAKYFEDLQIPEFVREAKVKKKFTVICDIMSALFINFNKKPVQRDHLIGYISMVHKDMGLSLRDLENFISCIMECLCTELPKLMTVENVLIQMKYFNIVCEAMLDLMDELRKKIDHIILYSGKQTFCGWCYKKDTEILYNYPLKYWMYKKRYWEYRRAVWASLDLGSMGVSIVTPDQRRLKLLTRRRTMEIRRANQRRHTWKPINKRTSTDSDQVLDKSLYQRSLHSSWLFINQYGNKSSNNKIPKSVAIKHINELQQEKTVREQKTMEDSSSAAFTQLDDKQSLPSEQKLSSWDATNHAAARERKRRNSFLADRNYSA